jgi:thymidine kinase
LEIVVPNSGPNSGWIEAICGPMFSGKSEELIRRLRRTEIARRRVQVFKPLVDTRYSNDEIVTHGDVRMPCESVRCARDVLARVYPETEVVGIDESNFFGPVLVEVADRLANLGKQVIIAGLDTDFRGRPFPPMPELLAIAESFTKMLAVCTRCGAPAKHSQRLLESQELIVVGASGAYEARCRRCFQPDAPRQEALEFVSGPPNETSSGD